MSNFNLQQLNELMSSLSVGTWLPREKAVMPQVLQVQEGGEVDEFRGHLLTVFPPMLFSTKQVSCSSFQTNLASGFDYSILPSPSKVNFDPISHDTNLLATCVTNGIQLVAYSSLGTQHPGAGPERKNPVLSNHDVMVRS